MVHWLLRCQCGLRHCWRCVGDRLFWRQASRNASYRFCCKCESILRGCGGSCEMSIHGSLRVKLDFGLCCHGVTPYRAFFFLGKPRRADISSATDSSSAIASFDLGIEWAVTPYSIDLVNERRSASEVFSAGNSG